MLRGMSSPLLGLMFYPRFNSRKASTTHGPLPRGWFYFAMERTGQASEVCPPAVTYRGLWLPWPRQRRAAVPNGEVWRAPAENPLGGRPLHPVGAAVVNRKQSAVYKCSRGGSGIRRRMRPVPRPEGAGREPPMRALACLSGWHLSRPHMRRRKVLVNSRAFLYFHGAVSSPATQHCTAVKKLSDKRDSFPAGLEKVSPPDMEP